MVLGLCHLAYCVDAVVWRPHFRLCVLCFTGSARRGRVASFCRLDCFTYTVVGVMCTCCPSAAKISYISVLPMKGRCKLFIFFSIFLSHFLSFIHYSLFLCTLVFILLFFFLNFFLLVSVVRPISASHSSTFFLAWSLVGRRDA